MGFVRICGCFLVMGPLWQCCVFLKWSIGALRILVDFAHYGVLGEVFSLLDFCSLMQQMVATLQYLLFFWNYRIILVAVASQEGYFEKYVSFCFGGGVLVLLFYI